MIKSFITKTRWLVTIILLLSFGISNAWGTTARISAYGNIVSGQTYWVGATVSSTDYYFKAGGGIAAGTGLSGTSTTTPMTDGTVVKFTGSSTSWTVQFTNSLYMYLSSSKDNGKYCSKKASASWTLSNNSSLIRMTSNSHVLQKNSGNSLNFGSYGHGGSGYQKDVWLEPAYQVIYDKNGATGGTIPDTTYYLYNSTVTVSANSGTLVKTGYTFSGWNTQADGNGTNYTAGSGSFSITANKKLYAKWVSAAPACGAPTALTKGSVNASSQTVSWTAPGSAPANGYLVAYSTATDQNPADNVYTTSGNYTVMAISAGTTTANIPCNSAGTYNWWVRSKCSADNSSLSSWVKGTAFTMKQIYLQVNDNWAGDNANFAAYYWNADPKTGFTKIMTEQTDCEDKIYTCVFPTDYSNMKFVRLDPVQVDPVVNFDNRWNETGNLTLAADKNYYQITGGTGSSVTGSWTTYAKKITVSFDKNTTADGVTDPDDQCVVVSTGHATAPVIGDMSHDRLGYQLSGWKDGGSTWNFATGTFTTDKELTAYWTTGSTTKIALKTTWSDQDWRTGSCIVYAHCYIDGTNQFEDILMTGNVCDEYLVADAPYGTTHVSFARCKAGTSLPLGTWESNDNVYNYVAGQTIGGTNTYEITGWGSGKVGTATKAGSAYVAPTYTISFDKGIGTGGSTESHTGIACNGSQTIRANGFNKANYHFTGWTSNVSVKVGGESTTSVGAGATITNITQNITLTAQWAPDEYSVTATLTNVTPNSAFPSSFTYTGSSTTALNRTLSAATGYNLPENITVTMGGSTLTKGTHYTYDSSTGAFAFTATITGNIVITVSGVAKTYSNTLDREGGTTGSTTVTTTYNSNTLTGYTAPSKTGYTFGGYWSGDDGTGTEVIGTNGALKASVTVSAVAWTNSSSQWVKDGAVTMYAKWTAKNYTVTLNDGSGSGGSGSKSVTYNANTNLTTNVAVPTYAGNDFRGYYTSTGGGGTKVIDGNGAWIRGTSYVDASGNWVYDGSPTLHAYWTAYTYENYRTMCAAVTCGAPDLNSPSSITAYGATISWTDAGKAGTLDHYEYAVWADGTDEPTSGFTSTGTTKSATISGLLSNTLYNYKVRRVCEDDDNSSWSDGTFTTSYVALTFSVPTGASAVAGQNSNVALPDADVPSNSSDCYAFIGWTTASYTGSTKPAKFFAEGEYAHLASGDGTTLYAVYDKTVYKWIKNLSDIVDGEYYVLTDVDVNDNEYALTNTAYVEDAITYDYAASTDITSDLKQNAEGYFLYHPDPSIVWKFTGTTSSGTLYNEAEELYIDLSDKSQNIIQASTSDHLKFAKFDGDRFDIASTTETDNYLYMYLDKNWGVDDEHDGYYSCYMYKRQTPEITTSPSCTSYTIAWKEEGETYSTGTPTTSTSACNGIEALPTPLADNALSCGDANTRFVGWSESELVGTGHDEPDDLFDSEDNAPAINDSKTFHAVYATVDTETDRATSVTSVFTSASWGDLNSLWSSGKAGAALVSDRGVQVTKTYTGANATTVASYRKVTSVVVKYSTNKDAGAGTISISVGGTAMDGAANNADYDSGNGTLDKIIEFKPVAPATDLTGAVKITVTCGTNSIYIKSVKINYTGYGYKDYITKCCTEPTFTISGTGKTVTDGKISFPVLREDLGGASTSTWAELPITISSNSSGAITILESSSKTAWSLTSWESRAESGGTPTASDHATFTNPSAGNYLFKVKTTTGLTGQGTYRIGIHQEANGTYCEATVYLWVDVTLRDKFVDKVNANTTINVDGHGSTVTTPTESSLDADKNDDCHETTRRLVGWVKETDMDTWYGSSSDRTRDLDDKKEDAKLVAPGATITTSGATWYAVWGIEE